MTTEKPLDLFPIPAPFEDTTPFVEMDFWRWAKGKADSGDRKGIDPFHYLESLGFVKGQHRITEDQLQRLRYAAETFAWGYPKMGDTPLPWEKLFRPAKEEEQSYSVYGKEGRWVPTPELLKSFSSGWIYNINPSNTGFRLYDGKRLFAQYQTIIGSRFLAVVASEV